MKNLFACVLGIALCLAPGLASAAKSEKEINKERSEVRKNVQTTLSKLYKLQPESKSLIGCAAGYAVLNNFGMKILVAGSGTGKGIAFDKASGKQTFMKMVELQAGLGMGIKKFSQIWVFADAAGLKRFMSGSFEMSGQANATAQVEQKGAAYAGAMAVSQGVWLYQLQGDGLSVELTAKGTKYYLDDDLN
jgi:lipid-binding SYLF domain-containing protein